MSDQGDETSNLLLPSCQVWNLGSQGLLIKLSQPFPMPFCTLLQAQWRTKAGLIWVSSLPCMICLMYFEIPHCLFLLRQKLLGMAFPFVLLGRFSLSGVFGSQSLHLAPTEAISDLCSLTSANHFHKDMSAFYQTSVRNELSIVTIPSDFYQPHRFHAGSHVSVHLYAWDGFECWVLWISYFREAVVYGMLDSESNLVRKGWVANRSLDGCFVLHWQESPLNLMIGRQHTPTCHHAAQLCVFQS